MTLMPAGIEIGRWIIAGLVCLALTTASVSDVSSRRIPNWTVAAVAGLYLVWAFLGARSEFLSSLEAAAIVFAATLALFAFNVVGAGDSKLMTAVALFAGLRLLLFFVLATVILGGALALFSLALQPRRALAIVQRRGEGNPGRGIPYGVAISMAGALVLVHELSCGATNGQLVCF